MFEKVKKVIGLIEDAKIIRQSEKKQRILWNNIERMKTSPRRELLDSSIIMMTDAYDRANKNLAELTSDFNNRLNSVLFGVE